MREWLKALVCRPLGLPLAMLVWALVGSSCLGLEPVRVLLLSLSLPLVYWLILTRSGISPRPGRFFVFVGG